MGPLRAIDADLRLESAKRAGLKVRTGNGEETVIGYDAETGEQLWAVRLGNPSQPYGTLGIDDKYITVINGTTMYQVIASDTVAGAIIGIAVLAFFIALIAPMLGGQSETEASSRREPGTPGGYRSGLYGSAEPDKRNTGRYHPYGPER
jgi:hypothetical protein